MFEFFDSETVWLNMTNAILGLATFVCVAILGRAAFKEVLQRVSVSKRVPLSQDTHAFIRGDLGITMADGGTLLEVRGKSESASTEDLVDPPNIFRSEN